METPTDIKSLAAFILRFIEILIPALFAVVFVYVIWKIINAWVIHGGDETKRAEGRRLVVIAVLVFVVMISTWGIVALIKNSLFG